MSFASSEELLLKSLTNYFQKHARHRDILYKIVSGQYSISLRVIDWFITHYAKAMNILYWIDESKNTIVEQMPNNAATMAHYKKIHLYYEYRAQLKSYTKMHFDPFRRHERITFALDKPASVTHGATSPRAKSDEQTSAARVIETTVGQLNFFRWALQNHVIDYIHQYLPQIEGHMSMHQSKAAAAANPTDASSLKKAATATKATKATKAAVTKTMKAVAPAGGSKTQKPSKAKPLITASPTRTCQVRFD